MTTSPSNGFNGRHMAAILVAFFGVVIAVNLLMARLAIGTFGGEVVENSYVASQHFNRWLDEADTERALGWRAKFARTADDRVAISVSGVSSTTATLLSVVARHPLGRQPDRVLTFLDAGNGRFLSIEPLLPGRWRLRATLRSGDHVWRSEGDVR